MALINTTTTGVLGTTLFGDGQGALTVQQDGVTVNKVTEQPVFRAYLGTSKVISAATWTKVAYDVEEFDNLNCYDSTTNYRFTPTVAGYYQINFSANINSNASSAFRTMLAKNGIGNWVEYSSFFVASSNIFTVGQPRGSCLIYMNGTTDYLEVYGYADAGSSALSFGGSSYATFSGFLAKAS
jgi:hypothetical protein